MTDAPFPLPVKTEPWAHQVEAYRRAFGKAAFLIGLDTGCGKSLVSIALANAWHAQKILVVCPLSVIPVWPEQFAKHSLLEYNCVTLDSGQSIIKKQRLAEQQMALGRPTALVVNYESVWRGVLGEWLKRQMFDVIIYDECHHLASPGGKVSWFAKAMRLRSVHRLGLSGTPMTQNPLTIYAVYRALDTRIFGTQFSLFRARYAVMDKWLIHKVDHYENLDELKAKFHSIAYVVKKRDVLKLPIPVSQNRYCVLTPAERKAYKELERDFYTWVDHAGAEVTITNSLVKIVRLGQCISGHIHADDGRVVQIGDSKAKAFGEWLEDLPLDEPIVVFCRFTHDVQAVKRCCVESGRTVAELSGSVHDELAPWKAGKFDVLVAQIQSGSEGQDFTRAAYVCFYSVGYSLLQYTQALGRLDRPGQTRTVTQVHMVTQDTLDVDVYKALAENREVVDAIIGARAASRA